LPQNPPLAPLVLAIGSPPTGVLVIPLDPGVPGPVDDDESTPVCNLPTSAQPESVHTASNDLK
jgi:hypothetical protein